jgi:hypothetical protein
MLIANIMPRDCVATATTALAVTNDRGTVSIANCTPRGFARLATSTSTIKNEGIAKGTLRSNEIYFFHPYEVLY